jgi:aminomethyltransferase
MYNSFNGEPVGLKKVFPVGKEMKKTPLHSEHLALGAKMAPFAGWEMPIQYEASIAEHNHAREAVSLFDACHMGEFFVSGDALDSGLERIVTVPLSRLAVKRCRYGFMLNDNGGIIDDLIVYRFGPEEWMIVVNAGHIEDEAEHFRKHLSDNAVFENRSDNHGKIDIQGPMSGKVLAEFIDDSSILDLPYFGFEYFDLNRIRVLISRTGYTGELGFEIYIPAEMVIELWEKLLDLASVKPAGLGARDMLRMEMGYPLCGQDLDESTTPLEAGFGRFLDLEKDFIGKGRLVSQQKEGVERRLVGLLTDSRRSPRPGDKILHSNREIGNVTSGGFSPSMGKGIGMGYVASRYIKEKGSLVVRGARTQLDVHMVRFPFYKEGSIKG